MLRHLTVRDFALMDHLECSFQDGFTVLTGETGAGKSILIDAISYVMGTKFNREFIRSGKSKTSVEAEFDMTPGLEEMLSREQIPVRETLTLFRENSETGRSAAAINGHPVLVATVKQISPFLLDIHGQHNNQNLLDPENHLEYLDENKNHEVDVLAGAFIMVRKDVLEKTGSFDENFFMYGEDIDLSYRIQKAGFKNYYFAESSIIHFKGESTRKTSLNYVRMFYSAMAKFVHKHYGSNKAGFFNFLVHIAIWIRAIFSGIARFIERIGLPLIDACFILLSFFIAKIIWSDVKPQIRYVDQMLLIAFPLFTFMYLLVAYYAGLYDRKYKRPRLIQSTLVATITLLAAYSLLPETYRFSRAIVLIGAALSFVLISLLRRVLMNMDVLRDSNMEDIHPKTLLAASPVEYEKTLQLMKEAGLQERVIGRIGVDNTDKMAVGDWKNIKTLTRDIAFSEIIFCEGALSFRDIIEALQQLPENITAKFHASGSNSIVGSDSKDASGETLTIENGYKLADPYNRRLKRLVDILFSFFCIITFPIQLLLVKRPLAFLKNCFSVLFANKTWVGYATEEKYLPPLRNGIIASNGIPLSQRQQWPQESLRMSDQWYARDYEPANDLKLLWKVYRHSSR